jgi:LPXTG-motif cell wall-anchored protein
MAGGPAETGNMMLIGLGLVGAASLTRLRTKRG